MVSSIADAAKSFSLELAQHSTIHIPEIEETDAAGEYRVELQLRDTAVAEAGLDGTYISAAFRYSALNDYKSQLLSKKGHKKFFKTQTLPKFPGKTMLAVKVGSKQASERQQALEKYFQALVVHPPFSQSLENIPSLARILRNSRRGYSPMA